MSFYAGRFETTEVNYSYYHVPSDATYRRWAGLVPPTFIFALKANLVITHIGRLGRIEGPWRAFVRGADLLGPHLGPILVQLPPSFHRHLGRLDSFLGLTKRLSPALRLLPYHGRTPREAPCYTDGECGKKPGSLKGWRGEASRPLSISTTTRTGMRRRMPPGSLTCSGTCRARRKDACRAEGRLV